MTVENQTQQFEVDGLAQLRIKNVRGSVTIEAGEEKVVLVTAEKQLDTGDAEQTIIEIGQDENGAVYAYSRHPQDGWWRVRRPCKVDFKVQVPQQCSVNLRCVSSSASLEGLHGEFDLHAVSGQLRLSGLSGELHVDAVSGDIHGEQLSGQARLKTVSGNIILQECDLPSLNCSTVSGNLQIQASPIGSEENEFQFKSVSGDIALIVPPDTACTVHSHSLSGRFKTSLPATRYTARRNSAVAEFGGGGARIHTHTVSGDFYLVASERDSVATPHVEPLSQEQRLAILDQLSQGELSVEKALRSLAS